MALPNATTIESHPKLGASWEGFVIERIIQLSGERNCHFWATAAGGELDLLVMLNGKRYGFEIKYAEAPKTTKSMHTAIKSLDLTQLFIIGPGAASYKISDKIAALGMGDIEVKLAELSKLST